MLEWNFLEKSVKRPYFRCTSHICALISYYFIKKHITIIVGIHFTNDDFYIFMFNKIILIHLKQINMFKKLEGISRDHTVLVWCTAYNLWTFSWIVHFELPFTLKGTDKIHTEGLFKFHSNIFYSLWQ